MEWAVIINKLYNWDGAGHGQAAERPGAGQGYKLSPVQVAVRPQQQNPHHGVFQPAQLLRGMPRLSQQEPQMLRVQGNPPRAEAQKRAALLHP